MEPFEERICGQIPGLRRYARALCREASAADDLVQDCVERALRKRHLWRPHGSLRGWLFRMLYRLYLNGASSARRRKERLVPAANDGRAEAARQEDAAHCGELLAAVDSLPEEQRSALLLMALEGPDYREAARILEIPVGTLRSRLARAREAVRRSSQAVPSEAEPRLRRVK